MTHRISLLLAITLGVLALPRPSVANAPACRYTIANGTVYDTLTKLTWQRTVDAGTYTQTAAAAYCAGLTLNGATWRLPKVSELLTLIDETRPVSQPPIDGTAFPATPANERFWTSTPYKATAGEYWEVWFADGSATGKTTDNTYRVRCVH